MQIQRTDLVKLGIEGLLFDLGFVFSFLPHIWLQTPTVLNDCHELIEFEMVLHFRILSIKLSLYPGL